MASKNLRKIRDYGLSGFGFTSDFNPNKYPISWAKFEKYVDKKQNSAIFNSMFKPLFKAELEAYRKGGHKMSRALKREVKEAIKYNVTQTIKARIQAAANPPQQSLKEQEDVLPEG